MVFVVKKNSRIVLTIIIILFLFSSIITSIIIFSKTTNASQNIQKNIKNLNEDILEKQDINKIYYAKIDSKEDYYKKLEEKNIRVKIGKKNYSKIIVGKKINLTINMKIEKNNIKNNINNDTTNNTNNNIKIDLYMHINKNILEETKKIRVYSNNKYNNSKKLISETPFLIINTRELPLNITIQIELNPIKKEEYCEEKTIKNIIPKEAYNIQIPEGINLNETIGKECTLILKHKAIKEFKKIILDKKYENYSISKVEGTEKENIMIE